MSSTISTSSIANTQQSSFSTIPHLSSLLSHYTTPATPYPSQVPTKTVASTMRVSTSSSILPQGTPSQSTYSTLQTPPSITNMHQTTSTILLMQETIPPSHSSDHTSHSETIIFSLAGVIVGLSLIIILLVLALVLMLIHNRKLKKLLTLSKDPQTYEVPIMTNFAAVSQSSVSTPSNDSINKNMSYNQSYDRLLQNHNSRKLSNPRRLPQDYELPVISNIATNRHTALSLSTESLDNDRNHGYGSLVFQNHRQPSKVSPSRILPQDYEVPVISNIAAMSQNGLNLSSESIGYDLNSSPYDTVLLSPLPSGVYDYISERPNGEEEVTMVIELESESERLRHASTRTYEEVQVFNDLQQKEK